jgi:hypothetical protein
VRGQSISAAGTDTTCNRGSFDSATDGHREDDLIADRANSP